MKTLTTILFMFVAFSSFADDKLGNSTKNNKKRAITFPAINLGNPEDIDVKDLEILKQNSLSITFPEMIWGNPEDIKEEELQSLKTPEMLVKLPEMIWGNPEEIHSLTPELMKDHSIAFPKMQWGNSEDININGLDLLLQLN